MLDIINRLDQPSWQAPLWYPQGPSLSVYLPFLAFTLISSSITNIQHSCEQFSRESDTGSPWTVTTGLLTQPSHNLSFGQRTVLLQQQQGSGGWCVKPVLDLVSFSFQDQLLSMHSCVKFNFPKALVYGCATHCPRGHSQGAGMGAGSSGGLDRLVCGCRYGISLGGSWEPCALISTTGDSGTTAHVSCNDPAPL